MGARRAERMVVRAAHAMPDGMRGLGPVVRALAPRLSGRDELLVDAGHGVRLSVPPTPDLVDGYLTGRPHRLEPGTRRLLDRSVRPGDVVLDVGANVGFYAFRAAVAAAGGGAVHAFEPQSRLVRHLRRSQALNAVPGRAPVHVHAAAVTAVDGERVALHLGPGPVEVASVLAHEWLEGGAAEPVPTVTLDACLAAHGHAGADVVKIDVEGSELDVLRGLAGTLAERPPRLVIVEALPRTMRFESIPSDHPLARAPATPPPSEVAAFLAEHGYAGRRITRRGTLGAGLAAADLDRVAAPTNVAFVRGA